MKKLIMDFNRFNKYLRKINNFENWDSPSEIQLSKIELDLIKEYVRKLYDALNSDENTATTVKNDTPKIKEVKIEPQVKIKLLLNLRL
ncbi:MAG: hypothetical protein R2771_03590 [Saprospiraceae bacterium]